MKMMVEFCPDCGEHWSSVQDRQYKHGQAQSGWWWSSWEDGSTTRTPSQHRSQRTRPRSTSQRTKGKGKGGKNKEKAQKGVEGVTAPSPFALYPAPPTATPWPAIEATPTGIPTSSNAPVNNELIGALKRAYPEGLPPEVQDLVDRTSDTAARQLTKDLHSATTSFGKARKSMRDAQTAETAHRQAWLKHLKEATKQWGEQLDHYRRRQIALQEAKMRAGQEVEAARKLIQALNSQTAAKETMATAVEDVDETKVTDAEMQEEEELRKALQVTLTVCAEASGVQIKGNEEIIIH